MDKKYGTELIWVNVDDSGTLAMSKGIPDHDCIEAVYTVDGNTVSLVGSSKNHVLGTIFDVQDLWYGRGDYESVYTDSGLEAITPPAGSTPVDYDFYGMTYRSKEYYDVHNTLKVVKSGNDIYIQGLAAGDDGYVILPKAWMKGTLNGSALTIPRGQFIGVFHQAPLYVKSWINNAVTDVPITYHADDDAFVLDQELIISPDADQNTKISTVVHGSIFSTKLFQLAQVPGGATTENDWMIDGIRWKDSMNTVHQQTFVAFKGSDIYVKGLSVNFPQAWLKGTVTNGIATFPKGQFMGLKDHKLVFFTGEDDNGFTDIVFNYDSNAKRLSLATQWMLENNGRYTKSILYNYTRLSIGKIPRAQPPTGIETSQYYWNGKTVTQETVNGETENIYTDFQKTVTIGYDGKDIYVQGISDLFPEAWVKGTRNGTTFTFRKWQLLGIDDRHYLFTGALYMHYFTGYDGNSLCDMVFHYDTATNTFSSDTWMVDNYDDVSHHPSATYADNQWTTGEQLDVVEVPQDADIEDGWTIGGTFTTGADSQSMNKATEVAFHGNDVYIKGLSQNCPDAWLKGTITGGTATFPSGQLMGKNINKDVFMVGYNGSEIVDIVFTYDKEAKTFTLATPRLVENRLADTYDIWGYYSRLVVYKENSDPQTVEVPENLGTQKYCWYGQWFWFEKNNNKPTFVDLDPIFNYFVLIGFNGDEVYVCGIGSLLIMDDTWIKGRRSGNTITFPAGQFLGTDDWHKEQAYFIGVDPDSYAICDVVFNYNPTTRTFTTDNWVVVNTNPYYFDGKTTSLEGYAGVLWALEGYNAPTAIAPQQGAKVKSVRYYNTAGMPCDKPTTTGLYIVVKEMEDGTVKTEKRKY